MKSCFFLGAALLAVPLFVSCSKQPAVVVEDATPAPIVAEATPAPATPEPATPAPVATPPPRRLAAEGTFFLLRAKSVETADGIMGLKPGTLVQQQADGTFVAEGQKIDVTEAELTNDLDVAGRIAGADARAQAAIRQTLAVVPPPARNGVSGTSEPTRTDKSSASTGRSSPPEVRSATRGGRDTLQSSSTLGAGHTMTKNGWLFQKNADGEWIRVRPLRNP